jgi:cell division protein FtsL
LFTESRQLFTESRQLFTESRQFFSESRQLFTESRQLFTESRQLFTESRQLFTESRQLFTESRQLFTESRQLFTESHCTVHFMSAVHRKEAELIWIAKQAVQVPLPPNWEEHESSQQVYFYDRSTGKSQVSAPTTIHVN